MKKIYQSNDGQTFDTPNEALEHERRLLYDWLSDTDLGRFCASVLNSMDTERLNEYFGTQRDLGMEFAKVAHAFEVSQ